MRRKEVVVVPAWGGRDAGKHFHITEWPADRAFRWAIRATLAYSRNTDDVDASQLVGLGMEAIAVVGVQKFLSGRMQSDEVIPILDELMECVQIIRDPTKKNAETGTWVVTPLSGEDDIAEVRTHLWLRGEVLRVHTGFSMAAAVSKLISAIMARPETSPTT